MFKHLRTKLTVTYTALFGLILILVAGAVYVSVSTTVSNSVRQDLRASVAVFDRLWALNEQHLSEGAEVLARDFGFRQRLRRATLTPSSPHSQIYAVVSNLTGLSSSWDDGSVISNGMGELSDPGAVYDSLLDDERATGVLMENDRAYQAVAAPILAPLPVGWVIFTDQIDRSTMESLERLSAIAVSAKLIQASADTGANNDVFLRHGALGASRPLGVLAGDARPVLELTYPLSKALEPYSNMLYGIAFFTLLGVCLMIGGSWYFARGLTRPIAYLDDAAKALSLGEKRTVEISSRDEVGRLAESFNTMVADISEREEEISRMANEDVETGLPNRRALQREIETLADEHTADGVVVIAVTLKRLTNVRNAIGHAATSKVVASLIERLKAMFDGAMISHVSTSRVAFALPTSHPLARRDMIEATVKACSQPVSVDGEAVDVLLCAGLAKGQSESTVPIGLIDQACVAADEAGAGRSILSTFDADAFGDPSLTLSMMSEMTAALDKGDMFLALQPKVTVGTGEVNGLEALIRWKHPKRGFIFPDQFIPVAEETGHIRQLTEWTIQEAIREQARLREAGYDLPIAVNMSGRQITEREFAKWTIKQIQDADANLSLEITETAVIDDPDAALEVVTLFREADICISIDDYGAGLSSLSYLKQIPANELKIDKSFVLTLAESTSDVLLVKSTIDLAHALGMKVVAEGVETAESLALLQGMGADVAQGYFISRPVALKDLLVFLDSTTTNSEEDVLSA